MSSVQLNAKLANSAPNPTYRLSTKNLDILDSVVKTASLYHAYSSNPTTALAGAAVGLILRNITAGEQRAKKPEQHQRAQLVASMCLTVCAAAYVGYTPGLHEVVPFVLGLHGAADGVYPLVYRAIN